MKAKVTYKAPDPEVIDLEDYGVEPNVSWDDLPESQQNEILDALLENECYVTAGIQAFED